jgi:RNA-directed DNA polymerase
MREPFSANGTEKQTDWNAINWKAANRTVRNLRHRIFRAMQEGNLKKVRSLQKLVLRSYSNRLISVRRVTQMNAGKNTPGVDKLVIKTPAARGRMVDALANYTLWKAKPARRVYIPKKNKKRRPLGIPVVVDRCLQALVKNALEPAEGGQSLKASVMDFVQAEMVRMPSEKSIVWPDQMGPKSGFSMQT